MTWARAPAAARGWKATPEGAGSTPYVTVPGSGSGSGTGALNSAHAPGVRGEPAPVEPGARQGRALGGWQALERRGDRATDQGGRQRGRRGTRAARCEGDDGAVKCGRFRAPPAAEVRVFR
ncbi:hypothetical protein [Streptomyces sp. NPDC059092]|uniref:hypothetical protein n=1 Tax=Streptomyces sp. NPDC059092 TaxID=3346725 RepID=UPI0036AF9C8C